MGTGAAVGGGLCLVVTIVAAFLIGFSFSSLGANEVGLDYSANSLTLDTSKLYTAGVHFLGVGHSFIKYPRTAQTLDMSSDAASVKARTKDGLPVELNCRLIYRLENSKEALSALYLIFGTDLKTPFDSIARSVIRNVASDYTAFSFWTYRDNITNAMANELTVSMKDVFVSVDTFLLINFELPSDFQSALTATDVQNQEKQKVQFEKDAAIEQIQTAVLAASRTVQIMQQVANSTATTLLLQADAQVASLQVNIEAQVQGYNLLSNTLGLSSTQLLDFVWLDALQQSLATGHSPKTFNLPFPKAAA